MKTGNGMLSFNYRYYINYPDGKEKGDHLFHMYVLSLTLHLLHCTCRITNFEFWLMGHLIVICFSHMEIATTFSKKIEKKRKKIKTNTIFFSEKLG